jgi:hypothetical protein
MLRIERLSDSKLNSLLSGKSLKIREGLYKQLREREWIFNRMEKNLIFLVHKNGAYGVVVGIKDIDWNEFELEFSSLDSRVNRS